MNIGDQDIFILILKSSSDASSNISKDISIFKLKIIEKLVTVLINFPPIKPHQTQRKK